MRLTITFNLRILICAILFCLILSIHWASSPLKSHNQSSLAWANLISDDNPIYNSRNYDNQDLESIPKKAYVVELKTEELVGYVFKRGYLCNDEDKAMCIQKTEKIDDNTEKRLTVVAYLFPVGKRNYIYKIEFVDEKRTLIPSDQDVGHNRVSRKDWEKYKNIEKFLIKQKIIRDGEMCLSTGQRIPLDGQPDLIIEDTYVQTKDYTLIHAETESIKVDEDAPKLLKKYLFELLEYVRNGYD